MLAEQLANAVRERDELCALVVELEARLLAASGDTTFDAQVAELQPQLKLEMERANNAEAKLCEAEARELKLKEVATPVSEPQANVSLASKILELEKNLRDETRRREAAEAEVAKLQEERAATAAGHAAAIQDWEQKHGRMEGEWLNARQRFVHTAGAADAPVHTAVSGTNPGGAQAPQTPHSESRWQNLKNIHTPTKWYKVPDVAVLSAATRRAQEALAAAEEELLRSTERRARYSEPWTPPNLQSFAEGLGKEPEAGENNQNRFR